MHLVAVNHMPTWVLKECLGVLISPITKAVHKSISLSVFPRSMNAALVKLSIIKNFEQ